MGLLYHIFLSISIFYAAAWVGALSYVSGKGGVQSWRRFFLEAAASNGVWAALSLALIFFILRAQEKRDAKQDEREQNYQKIIEELTQKLNIVADKQGNIERIRDAVTTHRYETDDP